VTPQGGVRPDSNSEQFRSNLDARRFYKERGFVAIATTMGENEEQAPDVCDESRPAFIVTSSRTGCLRRRQLQTWTGRIVNHSLSQIYSNDVIWVRDDGYTITDDRDSLDLHLIHRWLSEESYWAQGRTIEVVAKSIEGSVPLGCFSPSGTQVGFARWVTDGATFGWLCDVFVDEAFRGQGLGKFIVKTAIDHPEIRGIRLLVLGTRDAHELYRRVGFVEVSEPQGWMELRA
jgi:GNAT superfamily N-acetyltransferase